MRGSIGSLEIQSAGEIAFKRRMGADHIQNCGGFLASLQREIGHAVVHGQRTITPVGTGLPSRTGAMDAMSLSLTSGRMSRLFSPRSA